ncbi:MAG: RrF2 family transcriptional regulator [Planctomycetota bacterium]
MKLSTRVRYGCRAMVDLALHQDGGPVALEVVAQDQQIPERYLAKIIQDLRRRGLIRSVRGAYGGYLLSRPASEISLLDVWEALEGPFVPVECLDNPNTCEMVGECVTREVWNKVREAIVDVLESENLAGLVERYRGKIA